MDVDDIDAALKNDSDAVMAWSSSHLSEDDSDEEEPSSSSRSPSRSDGSDDTSERTMHGAVSENEDTVLEDVPDNWMENLDVDLPDGSSSPHEHVESVSAGTSIKHPPPTPPARATEDLRTVVETESIDSKLAVRDAEPVGSSHNDDNVKMQVKPKPASQIPRLVPPLTRKFSSNAASPPGSPTRTHSPPRLQRSASKSQSLDSTATLSQPSTTSPIRRGQSVYIPQTNDLSHPGTSQREVPPRGIVSTSSQFWASEQNRRSSRLLDEWKRKEIWHDFKRAEENVLTNPSAAAVGVTPTATVESSLNGKLGSASSLDEVLNGIRSDILTKQNGTRPPLRRATSFATKTSPEKAASTGAADITSFGSESWHARAAMVAPLTKSALALESVSKAEYDLLLEEKRRLATEAESRHHALLAEQEASRTLQERLVNLENSDRENRFLKEEIQKHLMHELSSKELVKTLEDQLALTARSEDQLKMQTRQLMHQNQALQADLLEKMASETSKIQKMAHLSAEKQKLQEDLQRSELLSAQKVTQERMQVRATVLRYLLSTKRSNHLKYAFALWRTTTRERSEECRKAAAVVVNVVQRLHIKALARSFRSWQTRTREAVRVEQLLSAEQVLATAHGRQRESCHHAGAHVLMSSLRRLASVRVHNAWSLWTHHTKHQSNLEHRLLYASLRLQNVLRSRIRAAKQRAFSTWMLQAFFDGERHDSERAKQTESELVEAKECVFSLSRAKTRLEEKLQSARQEAQRANDQLRENRSELHLVKHGFVTTVIRATERQWLRTVFAAWRVETRVELCAKEYRLKLEMVELQVEEREKYARSLDDYNKVLRNDLERFQFFSQDKRVAVDVLTKKLLREEEKLKQMEEQHVVLEEKMLGYKAQLASILEWESGTKMPLALVMLSRDAAAGYLRELFARLATSTSTPHNEKSHETNFPELQGADASPCRVSTNDVIKFLRDTNSLTESSVAQSDWGALVRCHVPDYAETQGLKFDEFIGCLNAVTKEAFEAVSAPKERVKTFWSALLGHPLSGSRGAVIPPSHREAGDGGLHTTRSPWAGQLSEDILQNQEKLLAVLEHETAVVERAVMEKSSLKHTYAPSEHSVGSTIKEFQEYQCDPVVPVESQPSKLNGAAATSANGAGVFPSADCQFTETGLSQFANWSQTGQVQDLFLAFRLPLQRVVTKYSNEKRVPAHGNQVCLLLSGVSRMLEDMRLYPTYLSRDLVHHHYGRLCDRDGLLTPQALAMFLGCCALELFAKSLPSNGNSCFRLSAREIVLSFFCDLGLLPDSEIPAPPHICLVGTDVETVLWPLFEYYSLSEDGSAGQKPDEPRIGLTLQRFIRFSADIVNMPTSGAERLFHRVLTETRRSAPTSTRSVLHLDEFYVALAYLQAERCPNVQYANLGESVRHWMQQTQ